MRKLIICFIILLYSLSYAVNGELTIEEDRMILRVWGTHAERGEAQGFLLADNIVDLFNQYILEFTFSGNTFFYNQAVSLTEENYQFEEKYVEEMQGIITGLQDSEADLYNQELNRELNLGDLKLINSIIDLSALISRNEDFQGVFGCSSLASWGEATQNDPELNGELVVSRLLDWSTHPSLIANSLMVIHESSEIDEQKWISFTYPGLIGALTAVNEEGVFTELNMGNISGSGASPYSPVLLDTRSGIEMIDYNQDSFSDGQDVYDSIFDHAQSNGFIIMICDSNAEADPVRFVEVNASGIETRTRADNTVIHGNNIVSTNHFRKLYDPVYCSRYAGLAAATATDSLFSIETNFSTLAETSGHSGNMMALQYIPVMDIINWSTYHNSPAYLEPLVSYNLTNLFNGIIVDASEETIPEFNPQLRNYPNPFSLSGSSRGSATNISFTLKNDSHVNLEIYNIKGQLVKILVNNQLEAGSRIVTWNGLDSNQQKLSSGIYLYALKIDNNCYTKKMLILR